MTPKRRWDERDVRIRPNPRGSRPRTKDRPKHEDAVEAMVLAVDRGRFRTLVAKGTGAEREVSAMRARELGRKAIVPGDRVALAGDASGVKDTLARIVRIEKRATLLRRSADDTDPVERAIVANADQLVIVTALADPEPRPRMVDRCLVAAYDAGLSPLLCLTKADLSDAEPFLEQYAPLNVPYVVTEQSVDGRIHGLDQVRSALRGRMSVFVGHSGVGKSTLVNALVPDAKRATGDVNAVTGRGRHTSSSAIALRLPDDTGWVIDTPGVRSFGLAHVSPDQFLSHFPDLLDLSRQCPRRCTHEADAPDCLLDELVAAGEAGPAGRRRLDSFRRLLASRAGGGEPAIS